MKTSIFFILSLLFILASATTDRSAVVDTDGNKLRANTEYYILPVIRGMGGGLTLSFTGRVNTTVSFCPLDVVQAVQEIDNGLPVTFSPMNPKKGIIREWTDQNIEFAAATTCVQSTVWELTDQDEATGLNFVSTGGEKGNYGRETVSNWFKIEKYEDDYKLVFCPSVCDTCRVICREIGIYIDQNERRRLVLSDVPFKVMFKKAD
ncbi:miraculin-like [Impatiens glandulifera]|uniref:miraculin-like n=1 Tax=Impatiens glandulifera TaxID=253017 RepID=UPI001FB082FF|nr:miraculin-like [Impatiens glandulifera]